jgi:hypothetical protein
MVRVYLYLIFAPSLLPTKYQILVIIIGKKQMYNKKGSNLSETLLLGNYGKNHQDNITLLNNFSENYYIYVF